MRVLRFPLAPAAIAAIAAIAGSALLAGCASASGAGEQDIAIDAPRTPWDLAALCAEDIADHAAARASELAEGVVRWRCGDAPGTSGLDDRGREYCEYHAINEGRSVVSYEELDPAKPLYCYFTSIFQDVDGRPGMVDARDWALAAELGDAANMDASVPPDLVRMKHRFNSRSAANALISGALSIDADVNDARQAACYLASVARPERAAELERACRGRDLAAAGAWEEVERLGVALPAAGTPTYEHLRDLTGCMSIGRLSNNDVTWRMSDPYLAGTVARAHEECSCSFGELPQALQGFRQGTWASADALPPGCRRVKADGEAAHLLTLCEVPQAEREALGKGQSGDQDLQAFCNRRFGKDIVLTAPLRAIESAGSCKATGSAFCDALAAGSK